MRDERKPRCLALLLIAATVVSGIAWAAAEDADESPLPAEWLVHWHKPAMEDRPLQIVHGIDPGRAMPEGVDQVVHGNLVAEEPGPWWLLDPADGTVQEAKAGSPTGIQLSLAGNQAMLLVKSDVDSR